MLPRHLRLRRPQDFEAVQRRGQRWTHTLLRVGVRPNQQGHNRFGFVVGRAIGKSVARNRVRRRLREIAHHWNGQLIEGHDIVIIARAQAVSATFQDIEAALGHLFERAHLVALQNPRP